MFAQIRSRESALVRAQQEHTRKVAEHNAAVERWNREQQAYLQTLQAPKPPPPPDERFSALERRVEELSTENTTLKQFAQQTTAQARQGVLDREVQLFRSEAESSADHPLSAALAKKDPKRLGREALRIAREEPGLTNAEILGRLEDELSVYTGLRQSERSTEATQAAASDTQTPATTSPSGKTATAAPTLTTQTASQRATSTGSDGEKSIIDISPEEATQRTLAAIARVREARERQAKELNGKA
jgi:hypothetical protein